MKTLKKKRIARLSVFLSQVEVSNLGTAEESKKINSLFSEEKAGFFALTASAILQQLLFAKNAFQTQSLMKYLLIHMILAHFFGTSAHLFT